MRYDNILLIGGSGFVGSHIAANLAKQAKKVTIPTRRRDRTKALITLPTVDVVEADVHDDTTLRRLMAGQDAVINLAGILNSDRGQPYGRAFKKVHVTLPARIVAAAKDTGIGRILHMSALGVRDHGGASMYLRSKSDGEQVIKKSASEWTVFRPSVIFGPDDHFLNSFAHIAKFFPFLAMGRADTPFQPIYVGDVATAFVNALDNPATIGKTYDLAGAHVYSLKELVSFAARAGGHPRPVVGLPAMLAWLQAVFFECLPGAPLISRDQLDSLKAVNISHKPMASVLNVNLTALEPCAASYLKPPSEPGEFDHFRAKAHR